MMFHQVRGPTRRWIAMKRAICTHSGPMSFTWRSAISCGVSACFSFLVVLALDLRAPGARVGTRMAASSSTCCARLLFRSEAVLARVAADEAWSIALSSGHCTANEYMPISEVSRKFAVCPMVTGRKRFGDWKE